MGLALTYAPLSEPGMPIEVTQNPFHTHVWDIIVRDGHCGGYRVEPTRTAIVRHLNEWHGAGLVE